MNKSNRYLIAALLLAVTPLLAEGNGGYAGSFLRIGLGARALGMGNAQVATADNGYGVYYNPAALANLDGRRFSASYSNMSLDRTFNYLGIAFPLPPVAGASIGWVNSGVNNLFAYNSVGENVGELSHGLDAIYLSFGVKLLALAQQDGQLKNLPPDLISIGLSVKYVREGLSDSEQFNYSGSGVGFDAGIVIRPAQNLSIAYQVKDLKSSLASNTSNIFDRGSDLENKFVVVNRAGIFYKTPLNWINIAYDFEWSDAGEEKHHAGIEILNEMLTGRFGYDNDHITIGGGLLFRGLKNLNMILDYAFLGDVEDEGVSHVFSWQLIF